MAMRYHWGLGIGHAYSHGKEDHSQQSTTSPSTSGEKNPSDILTSAQENPSDISTSGEENSSDISTSGKENPSDISHTAQNPDEAPGNNVKEIEAEEEEQHASDGVLDADDLVIDGENVRAPESERLVMGAVRSVRVGCGDGSRWIHAAMLRIATWREART